MTMYPLGYGTAYATLEQITAKLTAEQYHPEFVRRFTAWLAAQGGAVGVGGTRRELGQQPDRPGFAPEGKSFHQPQRYADGWYGPCAIDLVAPDGADTGRLHDGVSWSLVPEQGSPEARTWGVHCNIAGEPWHIQPVEIDGYDTWIAGGRPAPRPDYPIPEDDMNMNALRLRFDGYAEQIIGIHTGTETLENTGLIAAPLIVLPRPSEAVRAQLEAQLGHPLHPI